MGGAEVNTSPRPNQFWSVRKFKVLKALYIKDFNFRNQTLLRSLNIQDEPDRVSVPLLTLSETVFSKTIAK
ncbi:MAG: hypothetical protein HC939_24850 [Pleurocapsa sp. SU_5_0]|nr:hypothetical protein [Pleurocapsa sp. SU_5_0]